MKWKFGRTHAHTHTRDGKRNPRGVPVKEAGTGSRPQTSREASEETSPQVRWRAAGPLRLPSTPLPVGFDMAAPADQRSVHYLKNLWSYKCLKHFSCLVFQIIISE